MAAFAVVVASGDARAQDPTRLPGMTIRAEPGPHLMVGIVRDTFGFPIEGVDVTIPRYQRRTISRVDGTFRFDELRAGKYEVRARRIGYAPQVRTITVDSLGGIGDFELLPLARALPAVVSSAARGGLSGVVGDTAFQSLPGAEVRVLGKDMVAETDSGGAFYLPVREGRYMVSITKPGFADRVVGVTIPSDSGRRITAFLQPAPGKKPVKEVWNLTDLRARMAWRDKITTGFYTHEDMEKLGIEWIYDAVHMGTNLMGWSRAPDTECSVIIDGGPRAAVLSSLTVDEVETVEVYAATLRASDIDNMKRPRGQSSKPVVHVSNASVAVASNQGLVCPTVYVWMR
jgi:hypothetical protein